MGGRSRVSRRPVARLDPVRHLPTQAARNPRAHRADGAALAALYIFARPQITMMAHRTDLQRVVPAKLDGKIVSRPGYLTFARVSLKGGVATPIMTTGAGILSSVARAEGYVLVPEEVEGREKGEVVEVNLIE
jgi:molybdopterin molybdotransferase